MSKYKSSLEFFATLCMLFALVFVSTLHWQFAVLSWGIAATIYWFLYRSTKPKNMRYGTKVITPAEINTDTFGGKRIPNARGIIIDERMTTQGKVFIVRHDQGGVGWYKEGELKLS